MLGLSKTMSAWTRSDGEVPWWFTVLQHLDDDSDSDDSDYIDTSTSSDSEPDDDPESIDIEHTDNESESDWSEHSSDDEFIDDPAAN